MSRELISHSPDLQSLVADGYEVEIVAAYVVVRRVPYVRPDRGIAFGDLVSSFSLDGQRLAPPSDHTIYFRGEYPCDDNGQPIEAIRNATVSEELALGLHVDYRFSARPPDGYRDFHHKMTHYAQVISRYAKRLDRTVTARSGSLTLRDDPNDPFNYIETASSRAGITKLNELLSVDKIGIVGLGGTGSYILDYVSKTRVAEIHLFDGDDFLQHNAFRAPGSTSAEEIARRTNKAQLFADRYGRMRKGIVPHPAHVDRSSMAELLVLDFVFVAIDSNDTKRWLLPTLERERIPFIDVGMGIERTGEQLLGVLRTSTSSHESGFYAPQMRRVLATSEHNEGAEYQRNIQVVELNALNAALAVVRWKKLRGFYVDMEREHQSTYTLDGNQLTNSGHLQSVESA